MALKHGRFGEFTACGNCPTCKYVKQTTIGVICPTCSKGDLIERRSRRGKTFYGCNRYPECDFVAWAKPVAETCPQCGGAYLVEKWLKEGAVLQCPNAESKHKRALEPVASAIIGRTRRTGRIPSHVKWQAIDSVGLSPCPGRATG
jgi:DNA topoisomerase-1